MRSEVLDGATSAGFPSPDATAALLRQARALAGVAVAGLKPLLGKRLALVSARPGDGSCREFEQAATALGALVSLVHPGLDENSSAPQVEATARLLSQLYDGAEFQHLPESLVARIGGSARIPVFCGLATPEHPTAALADALGEGMPLALRRRLILQAALMLSLH